MNGWRVIAHGSLDLGKALAKGLFRGSVFLVVGPAEGHEAARIARNWRNEKCGMSEMGFSVFDCQLQLAFLHEGNPILIDENPAWLQDFFAIAVKFRGE